MVNVGLIGIGTGFGKIKSGHCVFSEPATMDRNRPAPKFWPIRTTKGGMNKRVNERGRQLRRHSTGISAVGDQFPFAVSRKLFPAKSAAATQLYRRLKMKEAAN